MLDFYLNKLKIKTVPLIGLDIGSSSIKLLLLSKNVGGFRVDGYVIEPLPPGAVVEKEIKQVEQVINTIKRAYGRLKTNIKLAAIAVTGSAVVTRTVQMSSNYDQHDIMEQIQVEAERYLPFAIDEVYFDFEILGLSSKNKELLDVLIAAVRIDTVDMRLDLLQSSGLEVTIVDVEALAMERAFQLLIPQFTQKREGQQIALFDIGANITTLHVFKDDHFVYNREQIFGGKQLLDEIQRRYGLSLQEAILARKQNNLPEDYIIEVLEPFKETVCQQLSRAMQVYTSTHDDSEIDYIVLSGGGAEIGSIDSNVQEATGIKTSIANPFVNMQVSLSVNHESLMQDAPGLLLACGLAMRNFDK